MSRRSCGGSRLIRKITKINQKIRNTRCEMRGTITFSYLTSGSWFSHLVSRVSHLALSPVAVNPHPTLAAVRPMSCDPNRVGMRWFGPRAVNPDVVLAIPAVIAGLPNPTCMRTWTPLFNDGCGRTDTNHHLRSSNTAGCEEQTTNYCKDLLLHGFVLLCTGKIARCPSYRKLRRQMLVESCGETIGLATPYTPVLTQMIGSKGFHLRSMNSRISISQRSL